MSQLTTPLFICSTLLSLFSHFANSTVLCSMTLKRPLLWVAYVYEFLKMGLRWVDESESDQLKPHGVPFYVPHTCQRDAGAALISHNKSCIRTPPSACPYFTQVQQTRSLLPRGWPMKRMNGKSRLIHPWLHSGSYEALISTPLPPSFSVTVAAGGT